MYQQLTTSHVLKQTHKRHLVASQGTSVGPGNNPPLRSGFQTLHTPKLKMSMSGVGRRRIRGRDGGPGSCRGRGPGDRGGQGCQGGADRAGGHQERTQWAPGAERALERTLWVPGLERTLEQTLVASQGTPAGPWQVVLKALQGDPFEPLQSVELSVLSIKMAFLTVLTSVKKVMDHPAISVNWMCLEFWPALYHIVLRPWPSWVLKVPTTLFRDQTVTRQTLPPDEGDPALSLLCPVHAYSHISWLHKEFKAIRKLLVRHIKSEVLGVRAHLTRCITASLALVKSA